MLSLIFALLTGGAHADVLLRPAFLYTTDSIDGGDGPTTTTRTLLDGAFGYKFQKNWMILGMYGSDSKNVSNSGGSSKIDRTSLGAGAGYLFKNGFVIDAVYFVQSQYKVNSVKYDGTGWQVDVGYLFAFEKFAVGALLAYRSFAYDKFEGQKLATPLKLTNLDPLITLQVTF